GIVVCRRQLLEKRHRLLRMQDVNRELAEPGRPGVDERGGAQRLGGAVGGEHHGGAPTERRRQACLLLHEDYRKLGAAQYFARERAEAEHTAARPGAGDDGVRGAVARLGEDFLGGKADAYGVLDFRRRIAQQGARILELTLSLLGERLARRRDEREHLRASARVRGNEPRRLHRRRRSVEG